MLEVKKIINNNAFSFLLSIFSVIAIPYILPISDLSTIKLSFIWVILIIPLYFWYSFTLKDINGRDLLFCIFPSIIMSACLKVGRDLSLYGELSHGFLSTVKNFILIIGLSFLICSVLLSLIKIQLVKQTKNQLNKSYSFSFLFCLFLGVWFPVFLIFWPGIYTYDAAMQISQLVNNEVTAHHPVIHTLLLNIIILVGKITGSYYLGAVVHTVLQVLICASVNAYVCSRLSTFRINKYFYYILLIYYLFFPLNMLTPFYITKDTLFSTFFFLLIFKLCEYYLMEKKELSKKKALELIIIIVLVGLFRNNAIYALLATVPLLFFIKKIKIRRNLIFIFTLGSLVTLITNQVLIKITDAKPGMEGQMYSVPLQQIARSYNNNPSSFTEKDKEELFAYVSENDIKRYNPRISDYVKSYFTLRKEGNSSYNFLKLWMKISVKNEKNYVDAFLMMTQGYWDPDFQFPDKYYKIPIVELRSKDTVLFGKFDEKSWFPKIREKMINAFYFNHTYKKLPLISLLFSPAVTIWMFLFLFLFSIYKRFRDSYFIYVFLIMYLGTLILGPVALVRYIYPYMLILPIMLVFVFNRNETQNKV